MLLSCSRSAAFRSDLLSPQGQYDAALRASHEAEATGAGGVVLALAVYLDAAALPPSAALLEVPGAELLKLPRCLNVTRQLQLCAEESCTPKGAQVRLTLPPKSKSSTPGILDPCPGRPKSLMLRYWFGGRPHQAVFDDHQTVHIPRRQHVAACPHLQADFAAASPLEACVLPRMSSGSPPPPRRRRGRNRSSMAPGDIPHPAQWTSAAPPSALAFHGEDGPPGQVLLSPAAHAAAGEHTSANQTSSTPRKHRRPSTVVRRPSVKPCVAPDGSSYAQSASAQVQHSRPGGGGGGWGLALAAGITVSAAAAAFVLSNPKHREVLSSWFSGISTRRRAEGGVAEHA